MRRLADLKDFELINEVREIDSNMRKGDESMTEWEVDFVEGVLGQMKWMSAKQRDCCIRLIKKYENYLERHW